MEPALHDAPPVPMTEAECAGFFAPLIEDIGAELAGRLALARARHDAALAVLEFASSAVDEAQLRGADPEPARDALIHAQRDAAEAQECRDRLARRVALLDRQNLPQAH